MSQKFVKFPNMWRVCLAEAQADGSAYRVAFYLLDKAGFVNPVPLGNRVLAKHGVSRYSKWRALELLRKTGLIAVEQRKGKAPLVNVRWTC
jgi:acyl dehydratase